MPADLRFRGYMESPEILCENTDAANRAWEQLSPTEAAAAIGIPPVTARSRLHRARLRAQGQLGVLTTATDRGGLT